MQNVLYCSADMDGKLGQFCVCSTICMHADSTDRSAIAFANFNFRGFNFRAFFTFREIREKLYPREKKALPYSLILF